VGNLTIVEKKRRHQGKTQSYGTFSKRHTRFFYENGKFIIEGVATKSASQRGRKSKETRWLF